MLDEKTIPVTPEDDSKLSVGPVWLTLFLPVCFCVCPRFRVDVGAWLVLLPPYCEDVCTVTSDLQPPCVQRVAPSVFSTVPFRTRHAKDNRGKEHVLGKHQSPLTLLYFPKARRSVTFSSGVYRRKKGAAEGESSGRHREATFNTSAASRRAKELPYALYDSFTGLQVPLRSFLCAEED